MIEIWISPKYALYSFHFVSVPGQDKGQAVKYSPLPEGTPEGEGLYLNVYRESSPNTDII